MASWNVTWSFLFVLLKWTFLSQNKSHNGIWSKETKRKARSGFQCFSPVVKSSFRWYIFDFEVENSLNPFLRQPLWRHNFAFCFQQRWHLWGVVWSHCDWIHNISQFIFFQQRVIVRIRIPVRIILLNYICTNFWVWWPSLVFLLVSSVCPWKITKCFLNYREICKRGPKWIQKW